LFFASTAIYPAAIMPSSLHMLTHLNPLTHEVDALRALMLAYRTTSYGLTVDVTVLIVATAILVSLGRRRSPRVAT
jgi:ABC-2 type transport system permease protein